MGCELQGAGRFADSRTATGDPPPNGHPRPAVGAEMVVADSLRDSDAGCRIDGTGPPRDPPEVGDGFRGRRPLPVVRVIASPTGSGKSEAAAKHVAEVSEAVWLADRH